MSQDTLAKLKDMPQSLQNDAGATKNQVDATRLHTVAEILEHPAM
jgi:hypothetical protein